jgi:hypothetical protein
VKLLKRAFAIVAVVSGMGLLSAPASAIVVEGQFLGVVAGNDSPGVILSEFGLDVMELAKVEAPRSITTPTLSNDGLTLSDFVLVEDNGIFEATSGKWTYDGSLGIVDLIVVKAGNDFAAFLFNDAITENMRTMGLFSTTQLDDKGFSHVTAYKLSAVPLPPAVWLFVTALLALGGVIQRRKSVAA